MGVYDNTFNPTSKDTHAERNKEAVAVAKTTKAAIFDAMGIEEIEEYTFNYFKNRTAREIFGILLGCSPTKADYIKAYDKAKKYSMIEDVPIQDTSCELSVVNAHTTLDNFLKVFEASIHPESEDGVLISKSERENMMLILELHKKAIAQMENCIMSQHH